jgi:hypothetical protein
VFAEAYLDLVLVLCLDCSMLLCFAISIVEEALVWLRVPLLSCMLDRLKDLCSCDELRIRYRPDSDIRVAAVGCFWRPEVPLLNYRAFRTGNTVSALSLCLARPQADPERA